METSTQNEKPAYLFKSHMPSIKYCFRNGEIANFVNHRYATQNETLAKELAGEIIAGMPDIYVDKNEPTILISELDPMVRLKRKFFEEFEAQRLMKTMDPTRDMGNTVQGKLNPQSSVDIAPVSLNPQPDAAAIKAKLSSLNVGK